MIIFLELFTLSNINRFISSAIISACHNLVSNHGLNLDVQCVNVGYNLFNFSRLNLRMIGFYSAKSTIVVYFTLYLCSNAANQS